MMRLFQVAIISAAVGTALAVACVFAALLTAEIMPVLEKYL